MSAARGARIPCIFAAWGYGAPGMQANADAVLGSPAKVPAVAIRLLDPGRDPA